MSIEISLLLSLGRIRSFIYMALSTVLYLNSSPLGVTSIFSRSIMIIVADMESVHENTIMEL
jgi:hypothetical protein